MTTTKTPNLAAGFLDAARAILGLAQKLQEAGRKNEARLRAKTAAQLAIDGIRDGADSSEATQVLAAATRIQVTSM